MLARSIPLAMTMLVLFVPAAAQAQRRACLTNAEVDRVVRPQIESGAMLIDTSSIDDGRPLCEGGTIARYIHRVREELHPEERAARVEREDRVRTSIARIAAEEEAGRARVREAERLEQLARIAEARRAAAVAEAETAAADADAAEARLRAERARRKLAALPRVQQQNATILIQDDLALDQQLDQAVLDDSQSWWVNGYEPGSMHDSSFVRVGRGGDYDALGYFRYTGGGKGWVIVRFHNGEPVCLEFHNDDGKCREPGNSLAQRRAWAALGDVVWAYAMRKLGI